MGATNPVSAGPLVLADRLTGAAWRLAGARVLVIPEAMPAREVAAAFESACTDATRVVLEHDCVERVPHAALARAVRGTHPLVVADSPDVVRHARRVLGVGT